MTNICNSNDIINNVKSNTSRIAVIVKEGSTFETKSEAIKPAQKYKNVIDISLTVPIGTPVKFGNYTGFVIVDGTFRNKDAHPVPTIDDIDLTLLKDTQVTVVKGEDSSTLLALPFNLRVRFLIGETKFLLPVDTILYNPKDDLFMTLTKEKEVRYARQ